jgi:hypothetical protein
VSGGREKEDVCTVSFSLFTLSVYIRGAFYCRDSKTYTIVE